jgi:hypothetical protein
MQTTSTTPAYSSTASLPAGPEDHLAEHPVTRAITPAEARQYLGQAHAAVAIAQSNERAAAAQDSAAAIQSYLATGNAQRAPNQAQLVGAFGLEEGKQRYAQLEEARSEGNSYVNLRALPSAALQDMDAQERDTRGQGQGQAGSESADGAALAPAAASEDSPALSPSQRAIARILRERQRDPVQAAADSGSHGVQPIPFTQAALQDGSLAAALRARSLAAGQIAGDYQTQPALLSRAEVSSMADYLRGAAPAQQQAVLKALVESSDDGALTQSALQALSVEEPVVALAGWHQANGNAATPGNGDVTPDAAGALNGQSGITGQTGSPWGGDGKLNASALLLQGNALLRPPGDKPDAKPFAMPPMQEMWHGFSELTGDAYADLPGAEAMQFAGARAVYAALKQQDTGGSTMLDKQSLQAAVDISNYGNMTPRDAGLVTKVMYIAPGTSLPGPGKQGGTTSASPAPRANPGGPADWNRTLPGLAPLSKEDDRMVAEQTRAFASGIDRVLAVTTRGSLPPSSAAIEQKDAAVLPGAYGELNGIGQWLSQDPKRGELMLQKGAGALLARDGNVHQLQGPLSLADLDREFAKSGTRTQKVWSVVKSLAEEIVTGDPNSPETAQRIGIGMKYVTGSPEAKDLGVGLLLGLLSMQGDPSTGIEKIIAASQAKEKDQPNYAWHAAGADSLDVSVPLVIGGAGKAMDPLASAASAEVAKGAQAVGKAARDATGGMGGGPPGGFAAAVGVVGAGTMKDIGLRSAEAGPPRPGAPASAMNGGSKSGDPNPSKNNLSTQSTDAGNGALKESSEIREPGSKASIAQTGPSDVSRSLTRRKIMADFANNVQPRLDALSSLDPDMKVGYRGSIARGVKGEHKNHGQFDPNNFDIDAFIVSDKLASRISAPDGFRDGGRIPEIRNIQTEINAALRADPRYASGMKRNVTFRIYTTKEIESMRRTGDSQYMIPKR